jgi:23S rRNA pseudouridine2605 synthase
LTDDGDFAYRATHPKFGVKKTYVAVCDKPPGASAVASLRGGVVIDESGRATAPASVEVDGGDNRKLIITLREGRNRQVRRMLEAVGRRVVSLERVAIGGLTTAGLAPGEWRQISRGEANRVYMS